MSRFGGNLQKTERCSWHFFDHPPNIFARTFHIKIAPPKKVVKNFCPQLKKLAKEIIVNYHLVMSSSLRVVMNDGGHDLGLQKADGLMMILHQRQWPLRSQFGSDRRTLRGRKTDVRPVSWFAHGLGLATRWRLLDMASWNGGAHQEFAPTVTIPPLDIVAIGEFTVSIFAPQFDAWRRVIGLHQHFCEIRLHGLYYTWYIKHYKSGRKIPAKEKEGVRFCLLCFEPIAWEKCVLYHLADPFGLERTAAGPKSKYEGKMFHHLE